ncbi:unnamed protein product [Ixodes hexagonus]
MSGYVGDLSEKQQRTLDEFKRRLQDIWKEEFTDPFLLRWLRGKDKLCEDQRSGNASNEEKRRRHAYYGTKTTMKRPLCTHRTHVSYTRNKAMFNLPFFFVFFSSNAGMLQCVSKEELLRVSYYQLEQIVADMKIQSEKLGKNVETVTVVCDYDNFNLKQVYSLQVIEFLREMAVMYEANYPETLERCLFINAPSFFPFFWKLVRSFVTEKTATKIEVYPQEGWKPVLLKYIDPSLLPVHWGGDRLGPDGDPECSHEIGRGGEVPAELYLKNGPKVSDDPDSTTCSLERGQNLEVPVKVERAGCILRWRFQTGPGHDVDFSVTHRSPENGKQEQQVLQVTRIRCDLVPETGQLENPEIGTYTFKFDNSFSWFTKKRLSYVLQVTNPEDVPASGS